MSDTPSQTNQNIAKRILSARYSRLNRVEVNEIFRRFNASNTTPDAKTARYLRGTVLDLIRQDARNHEVDGNLTQSKIIWALVSDVENLPFSQKMS